MSKLGKKPVLIPKGVKVSLVNKTIAVEGPKGKLSLVVSPLIEVVCSDTDIVCKPLSNIKLAKSMFGTTRNLIQNLIIGVTQGYTRELEIIGVGYKAQMKGATLVLNVGFSHPVEMPVPKDLTVTTPAPTRIVVQGIDKYRVGQFTANIRRVNPPEPYKGKGIRYAKEFVRKKLGKALAK